MSSKFIVRRKSGSQDNTLPAKKSGNLVIGGSGTSVSKLDRPSGVPTLSEQMKQAQSRAEFENKPLLVYLIVDLTASREDTRKLMRPHEQKLAELIIEAGGKHPVICKGVAHSGGSCSAPKDLANKDQILRFLEQTPQVGRTQINRALEYYCQDETESVLSLGVVIGDCADGDSVDALSKSAQKLGGKKRPLIVAHQNLDYEASIEFCHETAPMLANKSKGLAFSLGKQPKELLELLANYKRILSATTDELKSTFQGQGGIQLSGNGQTRQFIQDQTRLLLEHSPDV